MKNKITKENVGTLITAGVIFVVGVLFCCSMAMGMKGLSILIGTAFLVAGVLYLVSLAINRKSLASAEGLTGAAVFAFGVLFIANTLAGMIVAYIHWLLMAFGLVLIVDAFLKRFAWKTCVTRAFVIQLILGIICATLGACLRFIKGFSDFTALIFGVVMIVYSVVLIFNALVDKEEGETKKTAEPEVKEEPTEKPVRKRKATKKKEEEKVESKTGATQTK